MKLAAESVEEQMALPPVEASPTQAPVVAPLGVAEPASAVPFLLAWVAPQLLLLAVNWGDARFLLQSANPAQQAALQTYALTWLATFLAGAAWLGLQAWRRQRVGTITLLVTAFAPIALLVIYSLQAELFWPPSVAPWMLERGSVWLRQECLLLVPCYAASWQLLHFQLGRKWRAGLGVTGMLAIGTLLLVGLLGGAVSQALSQFLMAVFALAAVALGYHLLRWADVWWRQAQSARSLTWAKAGLSLFLPLGGLFLNASMEFPARFQSPVVYALWALNAVALLWPDPSTSAGRRVLWLARCAVLPFTTYFFVVFLPFLPYWLVGMLMLGLGVFILVPAALANLHFALVAEGWREHCAAKRSTASAFLACGAFCLLPVGFVASSLAERANLRSALHAIAYPELRAAALPQVEAETLRSTLRLGAVAEADRRGPDILSANGLPFIDDLSRRLVLGGLAIPAKLRADLAAAFLPQDSPAKAPAARRLLEPAQGAYIDRREISTTALPGAPGWEKTQVRLHLRLPGTGEGEWVAKLTLPPDAFITDHALVIDGHRVPSRVTDRNTALFVYERITRAEVPQDPGLVIYTGPETVEARVFPVPGAGGRETDFTITHRAGAAARIVLAGQPLAEAAGASASGNQLVPTEAGVALFPAHGTLAAQAFVRAPVRLILSDGSAPRKADLPGQLWSARQRVERVEGKLPLRTARDPLWPAPLLGRIVLAEYLRSAEANLEMRPQLEWVSTRPFPSEILPLSRTLAADFSESTDEMPRPVAVLRCAGVVRAVGPDAAVVWFDGAAKAGALEIYDRAQKQFVPMEAEVLGATQVQASVRAMLISRERDLHPERFRENSRRLWKAAREARTLTPQTAFLVVETLAQWAMLEQKEKERENSPDELTSPASIPEPTTWVLIVAGGVALAGARALKRKTAEG